MAGASGFLANFNDPWLKPRLLKALVAERLPQPGGAEVRPAEVASVLEAVRTHGLLTENLPGHPLEPKLAEAWRAAMDAWVERLGALVESDSAYSRWLGTCFLGVTFQECSNERFAESYSSWFEKVLSNLQGSSSLQLVSTISCTSMSDLFVRLSKFLNLKKEASSFAGRVVEPMLQLLNENGPLADEAIDLLRTVIKLYPSSVNRHYSKVESCIAAKLLSTEVNEKSSKKFARALASLPSVRVSEDSWSLMIRKILIMVNNLLDDAFTGLEEEKKGHEIMLLLVPPGTDPPPTLGNELRSGGNVHVTKKFRQRTVPAISALIHCCSMMLTSYYPVQVNVPVRALIALIRRVLLLDGSLHKKMFPSTTSLHQELICFELPSLHSTFLDLLKATIKGMRSQLLPHAASIIRLMAEYFKGAKLPTVRTKVYSIAQLLLISMGAGTSLHLLEAIVSNALADLNDGIENDMTIFSTNPSKVISESSSKSYSKKRKHDPQIQNSVVSASEKAAMSPRKKKSSSTAIASKEMAPECLADGRILTPLPVKIAALETLEILLNVGGLFRTELWRAEVDLILINVARSACETGGAHEQRSPKVGEPRTVDLQLASLKALLASFLSSPNARPPYLAQGMGLFRKGKLEIGTKLAEFCSHALLALDVLTHPRALALEKATPLGPGLNYGAPEKAVFGAGQYKLSSGDQPQAMEVEDIYDDWLASKDDEPAEAPLNGSALGINTAVIGSNHDGQLTPIAEDPKNYPPRVADAVQDVQMSTKRDAEMIDAVAGEIVKPNTMDPSSSNVSDPVYTANADPENHVIASFPEQKLTSGVSHLENTSPPVNPSSSKLATSDEASAVPSVTSGNHRAPGPSATSFAELFGSDSGVESDSEDSMPEIKDGDPDSD
ncbi:hypothetical protein EJB05_24107 [Eragrostis curvula]|uniref:Pre-rRNA-processing protein RIX1 N-terminal domain-containing protein n=1 Tax=Eragrostis curvula TaxID=38414 RepID=A0A5J9V9S6_9POAL|nr:hypothetical protein EJB05_24107 [Eragrostis curvula]